MNIALKPCSSSRICAHGYDADTRTLALQFFKKDEDGNQVPGSVYHYAEFEPEAYTELCAAESIGKFFGSRVNVKVDGKPKYPYTKLELEKEAA